MHVKTIRIMIVAASNILQNKIDENFTDCKAILPFQYSI